MTQVSFASAWMAVPLPCGHSGYCHCTPGGENSDFQTKWSDMKKKAKNEDITILPADEGRTTVIMETNKYERQMKEMLEDTNTYEVLKKDPTDEKKNKLKALLKPLIKQNRQTYKQDTLKNSRIT